ncbi:MAG: hypothetical protein NTZ59_09565 [Bacteroidetes bacterium]|nr:hypothetical protein [Bacteroidota bacterium]
MDNRIGFQKVGTKKGAEKVDNSKNKKPQVSSFPPYIAALLG